MSCSRCNNTVCTCSEPLDRYSPIARTLKNYKLESPIPDEVSDPVKIKNWFRRSGYIPYAGTYHDSNHTFLRYLQNLARLSPTLSSCINGIRFYAFSGKPTITRSADSEFDFSGPDDPLNSEVLGQNRAAVINKFGAIDRQNLSWTDLATNLYNSYKATGNAFLSVTIRTVLDTKFVEFRIHDTETVLYRIPELFKYPQVDVSLSWDARYMKDNPPKRYSIYPYFDEDGSEIRTMIHLKNGSGHYGRPDWFAAAHDAFLEVKNKEYLLKVVHSQFTGQVAIEVEAAEDRPMLDDTSAKAAGYTNAADQWASNFSFSGGSKEVDNPQRVLIMERPFGSKPMAIHEFKINTNEGYFEKIGEIAERNIIKVNMWSKNLSGVDNPSGFSSDAFMSELKAKMPVITHYQNLIDNQLINKALDFVGAVLQDQDYMDFNIIHKSPFETILKDIANAQQQQSNNNPV